MYDKDIVNIVIVPDTQSMNSPYQHQILSGNKPKKYKTNAASPDPLYSPSYNSPSHQKHGSKM